MTNTEIAILRLLSERKEIEGTEVLSLAIGATNKHHVFTCALLLSRHGMIEMIPGIGGRGNKTIYRDKGIYTAERVP